ncbi:MAG TPA: hypothetical protein VMJ66_04670 [Geobacteraceae bacterium]|nr:hypothetical protein [Geobacteraceae bacterium]
MIPTFVTRYLHTRALRTPWRIDGCSSDGFNGAVVIPALAESAHLFETLRTLAANPAHILARFLVLVVVNHREDASGGDKEDNHATLGQLADASRELPGLRLTWVDAASPGLELPAKGGGVGLARKIGLDLALTRLDFTGETPLLISLDADTLVEPSYLRAVTDHFRNSRRGGAVIPFRHRPGVTPAGQDAIDRYELFLRSYVLGLSLAGSPYAFHTVGSAMACTATAYIRMGGMNRRAAAEDFYFLQQLHRTAGVEQIRGTTVYPSARPSHRVPFGTGRSVSRALYGENGGQTFYRPDCFHILGQWLASASEGTEGSTADLPAQAAEISPHLAAYLEEASFAGAWEGLRDNHAQGEPLRRAFHGWFDGLRTMKLIHHLSAAAFPRCGPEEALPPLLERADLECPAGVSDQLELLRDYQGHASRQPEVCR